VTARALLLLSATVLLLPAAVVSAVTGDDDRVDLTAPGDAVDAQRALWQERFAAARDAVAQARLRYTLAEEAYGETRHRRRKRGDEKAEVLAELSVAETALAAAEAALAELLETARQAGVPPGWMRANNPASPAGATRQQP
jgi:hypothetical protein